MSTHVAAVRRALPLSEPERFLVLSDPLGDEIGVVRDLNELDNNSREVLREALTRAYSMTRITRILEVEREPLTGQVRWRVEIEDDEVQATQEQPEEQVETKTQILTALDQLEPQIVARLRNNPPTDSANSSVAGSASLRNRTPTAMTGAQSAHRESIHAAANDAAANDAAANDAAANNAMDAVSASSGVASVEENSGVEGEIQGDGKLLGRLRQRLRSDRNDLDETTQEREFSIGGQEDVQTARYPHIYIVDTERNRYEIVDCEALDLDSRRAAESYF